MGVSKLLAYYAAYAHSEGCPLRHGLAEVSKGSFLYAWSRVCRCGTLLPGIRREVTTLRTSQSADKPLPLRDEVQSILGPAARRRVDMSVDV